MIHGRAAQQEYVPNIFVEGAIKLTLGLVHNVMYAMDSHGSEMLVSSRIGQRDLGIKKAWRHFGGWFHSKH